MSSPAGPACSLVRRPNRPKLSCQLPAPLVFAVPILEAKAAASRLNLPAFISQVGRPPVMASFSLAARTSPSLMPA